MGLLDIFNSDDGRLGIGLLAAAGPRADGAGFGQRLQEAMTGFASQKDADMKRKFMQAQMDNYASEIEQRKAAIAKQQQLQAMAQRILGGQRPAMGGTELVNNALPPELRIGAQSAIPSRGGLSAARLEDITALQMLGGPDLLNAYKYANEGTERKSGSVYRMPNGEMVFGPPSIDKGMQLMPQPGGGYRAGLVPGALDASNALAGGSAGAIEAAKAPYQLVDFPDGNGGTEKITLDEVIRRQSSIRPTTLPQLPAAPAVAPAAASLNPLRNSGPPETTARQPTPYELAIIAADLRNNGEDPTDPRSPFINLHGAPTTPEIQAAGPMQPPSQVGLFPAPTGNIPNFIQSGALPPRPAASAASAAAPAAPAAPAAAPPVLPLPAADPAASAPPPVSGRTLPAAVLKLREQQALAPGNAQAAGDAARAKATADAQVKAAEDSYVKARGAADSLLAIAESRKAIAGGVYAGTGAETKLAIAGAFKALGLDVVDSNRVSNTDYLVSTLGTQLVANSKAFGSNPTESETKQLKAIMGTIGKDPQALNRVIDWQESVARRSINDHNKLLESAQQRGFLPGYEMRVELPKAESVKAKTATLADIAATAKASGKSTAEVTKRLKEKGYTIVGVQP
jgi:hypothetical protein